MHFKKICKTVIQIIDLFLLQLSLLLYLEYPLVIQINRYTNSMLFVEGKIAPRILNEISTNLGGERHRSPDTQFCFTNTKLSSGYHSLPSIRMITNIMDKIWGYRKCQVSIRVKLIQDNKQFRTICLYRDIINFKIFERGATINVDRVKLSVNQIYKDLQPVKGFILNEPNSVVQGYLVKKQFYGTIRIYDKFHLYHTVFFIEPIASGKMYHRNATQLDSDIKENSILFEYLSSVQKSNWIPCKKPIKIKALPHITENTSDVKLRTSRKLLGKTSETATIPGTIKPPNAPKSLNFSFSTEFWPEFNFSTEFLPEFNFSADFNLSTEFTISPEAELTKLISQATSTTSKTTSVIEPQIHFQHSTVVTIVTNEPTTKLITNSTRPTTIRTTTIESTVDHSALGHSTAKYINFLSVSDQLEDIAGVGSNSKKLIHGVESHSTQAGMETTFLPGDLRHSSSLVYYNPEKDLKIKYPGSGSGNAENAPSNDQAKSQVDSSNTNTDSKHTQEGKKNRTRTTRKARPKIKFSTEFSQLFEASSEKWNPWDEHGIFDNKNEIGAEPKNSEKANSGNKTDRNQKPGSNSESKLKPGLDLESKPGSERESEKGSKPEPEYYYDERLPEFSRKPTTEALINLPFSDRSFSTQFGPFKPVKTKPTISKFVPSTELAIKDHLYVVEDKSLNMGSNSGDKKNHSQGVTPNKKPPLVTQKIDEGNKGNFSSGSKAKDKIKDLNATKGNPNQFDNPLKPGASAGGKNGTKSNTGMLVNGNKNETRQTGGNAGGKNGTKSNTGILVNGNKNETRQTGGSAGGKNGTKSNTGMLVNGNKNVTRQTGGNTGGKNGTKSNSGILVNGNKNETRKTQFPTNPKPKPSKIQDGTEVEQGAKTPKKTTKKQGITKGRKSTKKRTTTTTTEMTTITYPTNFEMSTEKTAPRKPGTPPFHSTIVTATVEESTPYHSTDPRIYLNQTRPFHSTSPPDTNENQKKPLYSTEPPVDPRFTHLKSKNDGTKEKTTPKENKIGPPRHSTVAAEIIFKTDLHGKPPHHSTQSAAQDEQDSQENKDKLKGSNAKQQNLKPLQANDATVKLPQNVQDSGSNLAPKPALFFSNSPLAPEVVDPNLVPQSPNSFSKSPGINHDLDSNLVPKSPNSVSNSPLVNQDLESDLMPKAPYSVSKSPVIPQSIDSYFPPTSGMNLDNKEKVVKPSYPKHSTVPSPSGEEENLNLPPNQEKNDHSILMHSTEAASINVNINSNLPAGRSVLGLNLPLENYDSIKLDSNLPPKIRPFFDQYLPDMISLENENDRRKRLAARRKRNVNSFDFNKFFGEDLKEENEEDVVEDLGFSEGRTDSQVFDLRRDSALICPLCIWIQPLFAENFGLGGGISNGVAEVVDIIEFTDWIFRAIDFNQDGFPENIGFSIRRILLSDKINFDIDENPIGMTLKKSRGRKRRNLYSKNSYNKFKYPAAKQDQIPHMPSNRDYNYLNEKPIRGDSMAQLVQRIKNINEDSNYLDENLNGGDPNNLNLNTNDLELRQKRFNFDAYMNMYENPGQDMYSNLNSPPKLKPIEDQYQEEKQNHERPLRQEYDAEDDLPKEEVLITSESIQNILNEFSRDIKKFPPKIALKTLRLQILEWFRDEDCCAILGFVFHELSPDFAVTSKRGLCSDRNVAVISGYFRNQKISKYDVFRGVMHSLGHLFGASHDSFSTPDFEQKQLYDFLNPFPLHPIQQINLGLRPNSFEYSPLSKEQITMFLDSSDASCLRRNSVQPFCGDGILDDGEACDCGSPWQCEQTSPCCGERDTLIACQIFVAGKQRCPRKI